MVGKGIRGRIRGLLMLKKKWEPEVIVYRYEFIESEEFRKLIEETAEIIYNDFCQLQEDSSFCASNNEKKPLEEVA